MALWLFGGFAVLIAGLFAARTFIGANPARVASVLRWTAVAILVAVGILLLLRERYNIAFMLLGLALAIGGWGAVARGARPTPGGQSNIETPWLRMSLDHQTGDTVGVVLQGRFAGAALSDLSLGELGALLAELRVADDDSAKLLEAYITRLHGDDWREAEGGDAPRRSDGPMDEAEALEILGLSRGATAAQIREAHRNLMQRVHPDKGGSDYFAAKLNEARDFLLGQG